MNHCASETDRKFCTAFENCQVPGEDFTHEAHIRIAYVYLCEFRAVAATARMKQALLAYLDHLGVGSSKFHETMTGAWIDAVNHFMATSKACAAFSEFIEMNPLLLDTNIMLTHYSAEVLFSDQARARYVEPDIDPIPQH